MRKLLTILLCCLLYTSSLNAARWVWLGAWPWAFDDDRYEWHYALDPQGWVWSPTVGWHTWGTPFTHWAPENLTGYTLTLDSPGGEPTAFNFGAPINIVEVNAGADGTYYASYLYRKMSARTALLVVTFVDSEGFVLTTETTVTFQSPSSGVTSGNAVVSGEVFSSTGAFFLQ